MTDPVVLDLEPLVPKPAPAPVPVVQAPATPALLLQMAVQQGADLERLERLMALQERWEANEARKAFVAAMAAFKAEPLQIFKRKQVGYTTRDGDFVGYSHAELSDVTEVVVPAMGKHGLSHRWDIQQGDGRVRVSCVVTHAMGHSEAVMMDAAPDNSGKKNAVQQIASAVTYLCRYTLLAITGMSTRGMDDDGGGSGDDAPATPKPPEFYTAEDFKKNLPAWGKLVAAGTKTPEQIIATVESKGRPMTDDQKLEIASFVKINTGSAS